MKPPEVVRLIRKSIASAQGKFATTSLLRRGRLCLALPLPALIMAESSQLGFNRLDILVRLLAIEEMLGSGSGGIALYRKMQTRRIGRDDTWPTFEALIRSVEERGFEWRSTAAVDAEGRLVDGSHRLSIALHQRLPCVPVEIIPRRARISYGAEWFRENGFSADELQRILYKERSVRASLGL